MPWVVVGRGGREAPPHVMKACYDRARRRGFASFVLGTLEINHTMRLRSGRRLASHYIIAIECRPTPPAPRKRRLKFGSAF